MKEHRDSVSRPNKLFLNLFYEVLPRKFILLKILLLIVEYRGRSGWSPDKSPRRISEEMTRVL